MEFYKRLNCLYALGRYFAQPYRTPTGYMTLTLDPTAHAPTIQEWLPAEDPKPGENFYGLPRYVDPLRLAGGRVDNSADPVIVGVEAAALLLMREGYTPDTLLISTKRLADLIALAPFPNPGTNFSVVPLPCGPVNIIEEPSFPDDASYLVSSSTWNIVLSSLSAQDILICNNPGANCRINHAAPQQLRINHVAPQQLTNPKPAGITSGAALAAGAPPMPSTTPAQWAGVQDEINRVTAKVPRTPKCECGADKAQTGLHAHWCPKSQS